MSQQGNEQFKQLAPRQQSLRRPTNLTALSGFDLGFMRHIPSRRSRIAAKLSADSGWTTIHHPTKGSWSKAMQLADLNRNALFNAEFVVGHSGNTLLESQVLHSDSAVAEIYY
ncbi:hypothetical protein PSEUDO9AZ_40178 [Pseudomonas sp. 9AZ]|nr:hypothetical protein PSEUDO9AZ_40178 [Pseudomonas sp. 9AZ]